MESIVKRIKRLVRRLESFFGMVVAIVGVVIYVVSAMIILLGFNITEDAYIALEWNTDQLEELFDKIMGGFLDEE